MKIDGKDIGDWGLKVISYEGLLNLPSRREPTAYDWGDRIEPLVDGEDIFFEQNTFSVGLFYQKSWKNALPLKKYNISAMGYGVPFPSAPLGLRHGDGRLIYDIRWHDMYNIFTIEGGEFKLGGRFYPWVGKEQAKAMAHYLKSLPQGKTVIIATWNNPTPGRLLEGLPEALYDCGASREIFASPHFKSGAAYILIGRKGIGEAQGLEYYRGQVDGDPNAWIDADFYMQGNKFIISQEDRAAASLEGLLDHLSPLIQWQLKLETPYKNTRAKVKQIKKIEKFQGGRAGRFILEFEEQRQPSYDYPQGLLMVDQGGLTVDHYHVEENFSLILEDFKEHRATLKDSPAAIYQKEELSALKSQGQISLKLSGMYPSLGVMAKKIEQFKALMASAGTRVIVYKGYEYYSYLTSGIQIKTPREDIAEVIFTLNVTDKMKSWNANL